MREKGSNDVTIFRSSRYLYVGAGPIVGQMSVIQVQYFLIFFQIVCRDFPSNHTLACQQLPQSGHPSKFFSPKRDIPIGIYEHCGITYLERVTVFLIPYRVSRGRQRRLERYGKMYGLAMGPTFSLWNARVSPLTK